MEKAAIQSREDIMTLVDNFYAKVNEDSMLSPIFNEFAGVDWQDHLSNMYDFWSNILLGDMSYKGRPFPKHIPLPIDSSHFERWLLLFTQTVDENFHGRLAEEAKLRAQSIAKIFQHKLAVIRNTR